jgi:hypothetical protein
MNSCKKNYIFLPFHVGAKLVKLMRFEVLMAVKMPMLVFWLVMPCELVGRYDRFGETYCLPALKTEAIASSET